MVAAGMVSAPAQAAAGSTTVDDATLTGSAHFGYRGGWSVARDAAATAGAFRYTGRTGAGVTLTFSGTRASLFGYRQPAGGIATVTVDGRAVTRINLAATTRSLTAIYTTATLRAGTHTVTLTVTGRTTGRGHTLSVDRAVVYAGGANPAPPGTPPPSGSGGGSGGGSGIASLTFDDGRISQYTQARPILQAAGLHGTFYVISEGLDWGTSSTMGPAEVKALLAGGNEIGSHTRDHANLTGLSSSAVAAEFADAQAAIRARIGVTPTTCAYPYGATDAAIEAIAARYFTTCRGTDGGTNAAADLGRYDLAVFYVHTSTTAADVRAAADQARAAGRWIVFVYHGVGDVQIDDDVTTSSFQAQIDAIRESGIPVRTVSQALAAVTG
jgi:peptidoglycan/xylan/chitin deacetylase (PgdA/CDA1 family)